MRTCFALSQWYARKKNTLKSALLGYDAALRYFDLEYGAIILFRNVRNRLPSDAAHITEERRTQLHCYDNRKKNAVLQGLLH